MINNINNNASSEADAKQKLNTLNEIKKAEIKGKCLIYGQNILLKMLDELEAICDDNVSVNKDDNKSVNEDDNVSANKDDNDVSVNEDDNDVSVNKDDNENESESESESESENGDELYYKIKQLNNYFRRIDETKSFEEQIEILKKKRFFRWILAWGILSWQWRTNLKIFKAKAAYLLNDVDEYLFKEIFGHTFAALADKLINTTSKEENKIIINDIKKKKKTNKMNLVII